jgi:hypothetical protein
LGNAAATESAAAVVMKLRLCIDASFGHGSTVAHVAR